MKLPQRIVISAGLSLIMAAALPFHAVAQVRYDRSGSIFSPFGPTDETYDTHPAFEIYPDAYGAAPAVRVVHRCAYPNGWNVTDFSRDVNGIPASLDHTCPAEVYRSRLRARY